MNSGSVWRRWDLHVHTPESYHQTFSFENDKEREKYNRDIWEKYIDELESLEGCAVLGITDYFSIDGYRKVLEYREKGRLDGFDTILPNVEFRLDKLIGKRDGPSRRLDYHVIFSNEVDPRDIEKEFLEALEIKNTLNEPRRLTRENIEEIGHKLKQQHDQWSGDSDFRVGCINITVSPDNIVEVLKKKSSIFKGKYIIVLAEEGWSEIDWNGQDHLTRKNLLQGVDGMFSGNPQTRKWLLGEFYQSKRDFIDEFGSLKPCLHGSDAHDFERLFRPDEDRYCWIKAEPTFEGLRQILYEPGERIYIGKDNPEPIKSIYSVSSFEISNARIGKQLEIEEKRIPLNRNLVAVIGGKGDGKTAFLDLIANCFIDRCSRAGKDPNSFVQRNEGDKPDLKVSLAFLGGGDFVKHLADDSFFPSVITYLPQGKMEEYIADREKLHEKISEIIFEHKDVRESDLRVEWDTISEELLSLEKEIEDSSFKINQLREEVTKEIITKLRNDKKLKEGKIKDIDAQLEQLVSDSGDNSKLKVEKLEQEVGRLRTRITRLHQSRKDLSQISQTLSQYQEINSEINRVNQNVMSLGVQDSIEVFDFESRIAAVAKITGLLSKKEEEYRQKESELKEELGKLTDKERTHAELLEKKESVRKDVQDIIQQLNQLKNKEDDLVKMSKDRVRMFSDLAQKIHQKKHNYRSLIELFSKGKDQILKGIEFEPSIHFDAESFRKRGRSILDFRKVSDENVEELKSLAQTLTEEDVDIDNVVQEYDRVAQNLRSSIRNTWGELDFDNWIFENYFALNTEVYINEVHMDKLSMGQKGTVLLQIFLAEGDHPLILDQPEENLDNKFIYEVLVDAFRQAKNRRQIIIATHNANLVVNTDAEQTIVAQCEDNKITYKWGAIENQEIRESMAKLLEGGEEAFMRREQKYGFVER